MSASEIVEIEARRLLHSIRTQPDRPALDDSSLLALIEKNVNSTELDRDLERAKLEVGTWEGTRKISGETIPVLHVYCSNLLS